MFRKITLLLTSLILVFTLAGCVGEHKILGVFVFPKDTNDKIEKYLEDKYDENFEYFQSYGLSGDKTRSILFKTDKYEGIFGACSYVDGKYVFNDNYINYFFSDEFVKYIQDKVRPYWGETYINLSFSNLSLPDEITKDSPLEDYIKNLRSMSVQMIVSKENLDESHIPEIAQSFIEDGAELSLTLRPVEADEFIENMEEYASSQILNKIFYRIDHGTTVYIKDGDYEIREAK